MAGSGVGESPPWLHESDVPTGRPVRSALENSVSGVGCEGTEWRRDEPRPWADGPVGNSAIRELGSSAGGQVGRSAVWQVRPVAKRTAEAQRPQGPRVFPSIFLGALGVSAVEWRFGNTLLGGRCRQSATRGGEGSGKLQGDVGPWSDGCPLAFDVGRRTAFPDSRTAGSPRTPLLRAGLGQNDPALASGAGMKRVARSPGRPADLPTCRTPELPNGPWLEKPSFPKGRKSRIHAVFHEPNGSVRRVVQSR
ncbi:hypothetical protein HRbin11_00492 [bacterium HR11]|nr:hypothetical protein HRbin11_00492 [bacterium HR11]